MVKMFIVTVTAERLVRIHLLHVLQNPEIERSGMQNLKRKSPNLDEEENLYLVSTENENAGIMKKGLYVNTVPGMIVLP